MPRLADILGGAAFAGLTWAWLTYGGAFLALIP